MPGKSQLSIRCVVRRDDRVTQVLQETPENPEYRHVVIHQKNLQWAHFFQRGIGRRPEGRSLRNGSGEEFGWRDENNKVSAVLLAVWIQTQSLKHPCSDDAASTVTDSFRRYGSSESKSRNEQWLLSEVFGRCHYRFSEAGALPK